MSSFRGLRRLCELRRLEEQQEAARYQSAVTELERLEREFTRARLRSRNGREIVHASVDAREMADRYAGMQETVSADRVARSLIPRIRKTEDAVERSRSRFLLKRIESGQAESLLEAARKAAELELRRKNQLALDEWYRFRHRQRQPESHERLPDFVSDREPA